MTRILRSVLAVTQISVKNHQLKLKNTREVKIIIDIICCNIISCRVDRVRLVHFLWKCDWEREREKERERERGASRRGNELSAVWYNYVEIVFIPWRIAVETRSVGPIKRTRRTDYLNRFSFSSRLVGILRSLFWVNGLWHTSKHYHAGSRAQRHASTNARARAHTHINTHKLKCVDKYINNCA